MERREGHLGVEVAHLLQDVRVMPDKMPWEVRRLTALPNAPSSNRAFKEAWKEGSCIIFCMGNMSSKPHSFHTRQSLALGETLGNPLQISLQPIVQSLLFQMLFVLLLLPICLNI